MPIEPVQSGTTAALSQALQPLELELYQRSGAAGFSVAPQDFAGLLQRQWLQAVHTETSDLQERNTAQRKEFLLKLKVEELALAHACAIGDEKAWEIFLTKYRVKLFDMARQITREETSGRELADSIYAELYGTELKDGVRASKLRHYSGRGSLEGW